MFCWNVATFLSDPIASNRRRQQFSHLTLRRPEASHPVPPLHLLAGLGLNTILHQMHSINLLKGSKINVDLHQATEVEHDL
jgi:hypothetical protein